MTLSENEDSIQLITFNIGQKLFGINILSIREILRDPEINPLEKGPDFIDGFVRTRGDAYPVIDLKQRMGASQNSDQESHEWVMIANTERYVAGFKVDTVSRILKVDADMILSAPDLVMAGMQRSYIRGVCDTEAGMLVVLDVEHMLSADEINKLNKPDVQ